MIITDCPHEDNIEYGEVVYQDNRILINLVNCSTCYAKGAQYQVYIEDEGYYVPQSEAWHTKEVIDVDLQRAVKLISDLMTLCEVRKDYHGNGVVDEAYQFLVEQAAKGTIA